jgi:hypothetical protein
MIRSPCPVTLKRYDLIQSTIDMPFSAWAVCPTQRSLYYTTVLPMKRPSIRDYLPQPEKECIRPRIGKTGRIVQDTGFTTTWDGSVLFGMETREYFGILPAKIARAVPESVINCVACIVFGAHRSGRKESCRSR